MKLYRTMLAAVAASWFCAEAIKAHAQTVPPSYVGRWAADPAWCRNRPGTSDEIPITFTRRGMEGLENSCRFDRIGGGPAHWNIAMTCRGEGMTARDQIELSVDGNTMQIVYRSRSDAPVKLARCR
jgi:hypothetical protein